MRTSTLVLFLPLACSPAWADRISELPPPELCAYKARLYAAGYYHYLQGRSRAEVPIYWHGDETIREKAFVTQELEQAYDLMDAQRRASPGRMPTLDSFADDAYKHCMAESETQDASRP